jgi:hypothetical protein
VGRRWRNFGCASSGFRTEGGYPGEKVLRIDASRDWGDNGTRLLWSKRRSQNQYSFSSREFGSLVNAD